MYTKVSQQNTYPQQKVSAYVLEVDKARNRISLSLKSNPQKRVRSAGEAAAFGRRDNNRQNRQFNNAGYRPRQSDTGFNSFGDAFSKLGK